MATGGRDSLERRLFHQAYISPLAVVRDFFEALSELRGAARGPDPDHDRCGLNCSKFELKYSLGTCVHLTYARLRANLLYYARQS